MFNPLVDSFNDLTDNEIDESIRKLSQRYFQSHNPQVQQQIATLLEMYKEEMRARNAKAMQKLQSDNGEEGLDNLINVS
jgi:3-methyladenine DNA glycosylase AlkD